MDILKNKQRNLNSENYLKFKLIKCLQHNIDKLQIESRKNLIKNKTSYNDKKNISRN